MTDHPTLSTCPFCNSTLIIEGPWARHPMADCLMSEEILFAWSAQDQVRRWNQRAGTEEVVIHYFQIAAYAAKKFIEAYLEEKKQKQRDAGIRKDGLYVYSPAPFDTGLAIAVAAHIRALSRTGGDGTP